ncbi:MAG: hypothetical protein ACKVIX_02115 [Sphingomonadales bacterium]|jgi:chromosome segregation ATPase
MADKNQGAGQDAMIESEKRLNEALEKISSATRSLRESSGKTQALESQNSILENNLKNITTDYEKLTEAFQEANEKIDSVQIVPQENTSKLQDYNKALCEELENLRSKYSQKIGENELLVAEAEVAKLAKKTVVDSLDHTINRLEGILNTN